MEKLLDAWRRMSPADRDKAVAKTVMGTNPIVAAQFTRDYNRAFQALHRANTLNPAGVREAQGHSVDLVSLRADDVAFIAWAGRQL